MGKKYRLTRIHGLYLVQKIYMDGHPRKKATADEDGPQLLPRCYATACGWRTKWLEEV